MYGMLLESVQYFIQQEHGTDIWEQICNNAELSNGVFITHQIYHDSTMPRLARSCSLVIGDHSANYYMEYFGLCFVSFLTHYGYEKLLKIYCRQFRDFLAGIDNLHEQFRFGFPQLRSPSFRCDEETADGLTLHYCSHRFGYEQYVIGQIKEIAKRFFNIEVGMKIIHQTGVDTTNEIKKSHIIFRIIFDNRLSTKVPNERHAFCDKRTIPLSLLLELFPFGFLFDSEMKISRAGKGLQIYFSKDIIDKTLPELFLLRRPAARVSWKLLRHGNIIFELVSTHTEQRNSIFSRYQDIAELSPTTSPRECHTLKHKISETSAPFESRPISGDTTRNKFGKTNNCDNNSYRGRSSNNNNNSNNVEIIHKTSNGSIDSSPNLDKSNGDITCQELNKKILTNNIKVQPFRDVDDVISNLEQETYSTGKRTECNEIVGGNYSNLHKETLGEGEHDNTVYENPLTCSYHNNCKLEKPELERPDSIDNRSNDLLLPIQPHSTETKPETNNGTEENDRTCCTAFSDCIRNILQRIGILPCRVLPCDRGVRPSDGDNEKILIHHTENVPPTEAIKIVSIPDFSASSQKLTNNLEKEEKPKRPLHLRGQMKYIEKWNKVLFVGSPMVGTLEDLEASKLFLNDLSMHDGSREMVLGQTQRLSALEFARDREKSKGKLIEKTTKKLNQEKLKSEQLLYSMMPRDIADRLKNGQSQLDASETFEDVTVSFSYIKDFSLICDKIDAMHVVKLINEVFSIFDILSENYHVYKFETLGDAIYMLVSGAPQRREDHAQEMAGMALNMLQEMKNIQNPATKENLQLQIGMHSGSVAACVIGQKTPQYSLFGNTVNIASRMQSTGEPMKIHITEATNNRLKGTGFVSHPREEIPVKGVGLMQTFWLTGKIASVDQPSVRVIKHEEAL